MRLFSVSTEAAKTSFQETTNEKIMAAARPGSASGSTMRMKACRREQPIVQPASSSSRGMPMNRLDETRIEKGNASAVCTSATPSSVS